MMRQSDVQKESERNKTKTPQAVNTTAVKPAGHQVELPAPPTHQKSLK